jgi:hypothetical protein
VSYVNRPAPAVNGALIIQHIITADDSFGEPWPPDSFCSVVRRTRGFTLWRRFFLTSPADHWRTSLGDSINARRKRRPQMETQDYFPKKYFSSGDLGDKTIVAAIEDVKSVVVKGQDGSEQSKLAVYLQGQQQALLLNKTNYYTIRKLAGSTQTDDWLGLVIELYQDPNGWLRVHQPQQASPVARKAAPAKQKPPFDDEIPWQ